MLIHSPLFRSPSHPSRSRRRREVQWHLGRYTLRYRAAYERRLSELIKQCDAFHVLSVRTAFQRTNTGLAETSAQKGRPLILRTI